MRLYKYECTTQVAAPRTAVWEFFSTPHNLAQITPPNLRFTILSDPPSKVHAGLLIHYTVSPFWGVPIQWVTEISQCEEEKYFIDEQRFGPFRFWHHQHAFAEDNGAVVMTDTVHYALYCDPFSRIVHRMMVRPRIEEIFRHRAEVISRVFPPAK